MPSKIKYENIIEYNLHMILAEEDVNKHCPKLRVRQMTSFRLPYCSIVCKHKTNDDYLCFYKYRRRNLEHYSPIRLP